MRGLWAVLILCAFTPGALAQEPGRDLFDWHKLPPLPQPLRGAFTGAHNGALIVAGGTRPDGAVNTSVFVLMPGATAWQQSPGPDGAARVYGASAVTSHGVVMVGGYSASLEPTPEVLLLGFANGRIEARRLPDLPNPAAPLYGAALGNTVYVTGEAKDSLFGQHFLYFNVDSPPSGWRVTASVPNPGRVSPVIASLAGSLYLFGGSTSSGVPLLDGYRFTPGAGWKAVAAPPVPMMNAPAASFGESQAHILVFGAGDPARVWAYHSLTNTWAAHEEAPAAFTGAAAVAWNGGVAVGGYRAAPRPRPSAFFPLDYAMLGLYLLAMVGIGVYFSKAEKSTNRFFLGGRRVPWWAVGLSIFGTAVSSITYLSVPAKAFSENWWFLLTSTGTLLMAPIAIRYYLPHFRRWPITTAYEYLEKRFNFATRVYGSLIFLLYQIGRVGAVLYLPSLSLSAATGIDIYACILLMGLLSTVYTVMGGIEAVIWTDVVQSIILLGGALLILAFVVVDVPGGAGAVVSAARAADKFHTFNWSWDATVASVWVIVLGNFFATAYPMTADQTIVQRYLTTSNEKQAARAIWTNALLSIPTTALFLAMGTALWVFYRTRPELLDPTLRLDGVVPLFIAQQLPMGVSGVVLAAIFAAAMSTLSSSINSVASVLVNDYYRRLRPSVQERQAYRAARWISALFGLFGTGVAVMLAVWQFQSLLDTFYEFLGLVGGGLAGIMALGVFTRRANGIGALVGAAASAAILWWVKTFTPLHFFLYAVVGLVTAFVVGYFASLPWAGARRTAEG